MQLSRVLTLLCRLCGKIRTGCRLWENPKKYFSPFYWDAMNQGIFRPITRVFAVDPARKAINVNAVDEVPNSSWFENRFSRQKLTPKQVAMGACTTKIKPKGPYQIVGGKPDGANPGFFVKAANGRRYLFKFDGLKQKERATSADVIGSLIYYAAGFRAPCNQIVFFERKDLKLPPNTYFRNVRGNKQLFEQKHIDNVLKEAVVVDGKYRASTSLFLPGKPIGPWRFQGLRRDDYNDVIKHQERRELRGSYVLAAWLNHFDTREQNTLAMWINTGDGKGYVMHNMLDFGDSFGSLWALDGMSRRHGNANYFDFGFASADFLTLGTIKRPWDKRSHGVTGPVLGYYDVKHFRPNKWRAGYPNPAFRRKQLPDVAWMTRIVAEFTDAHIDAMIEKAKLSDPVVKRELRRVLIGRRDKILRQWLTVLSPLTQPKVERSKKGVQLCLRDLAVYTNIISKSERVYFASSWQGKGKKPQSLGTLPVNIGKNENVCVTLPTVASATPHNPAYLSIRVDAGSKYNSKKLPLNVYLYQFGSKDYQVVGLERPKK